MRFVVVLILLSAVGCHRTPPMVAVITGETMGTTYTVKLAGLPESQSVGDVKAGIEKRLETVNRQMSTWRKDSEISRFNVETGTDWFPVSKETVAVVQEADRVSRLSGGAFDVTVGPLVNLWSFGPENRPRKIPDKDEIKARLRRVGFQRLSFRVDPPALKKANANLSVDLSAIAKGFGVDRIADYLDGLNLTGYMVEIGGEVRCKGTKADGGAWKIGIQSPKNRKTAPIRVVALKDRAMATSGDYRNYFEQDGRRYSHTIDPRTGRPIAHRLVSVSVVADSCMTADALATTIMVLGPVEGYNFAEKHQLFVLLIVADGQGFRMQATPSFSKLLD